MLKINFILEINIIKNILYFFNYIIDIYLLNLY